MSILEKHLRDYLELRRGLGFELGRVESRLRSFVAFMETKRTRQITTMLALEFALHSDRSASTQAGYLSAIRGFAQYLSRNYSELNSGHCLNVLVEWQLPDQSTRTTRLTKQ